MRRCSSAFVISAQTKIPTMIARKIRKPPTPPSPPPLPPPL
jgi:hypothetical protein